ncbi:MAG: Flp pilus assembly protein CpaB [Zhaonellaceae bacterium]|jgi:pilus assembly protein CpaB|nr:Flp pilus assembly protein CpaB [Clostridia bacterium]
MINKKLIALAIILAIAVAGSVYYYLDQLQKTIDPRLYKEVIVARENIPARTKVNESMLERKKVPVDYILPEAIEDESYCIGFITKAPVYKGEQVLKSRLVGADDTKEGLAYKIPKGYRAVAIQINEVSGVGYNIRPSDRVDIMATFDFQIEEQNREITQTSLILQNIEVLAMARNMNSDETQGEVNTVTLAVSPLEAGKLIQASERGSIRLLLRSPIDEDSVSISAWRIEDFLERR